MSHALSIDELRYGPPVIDLPTAAEVLDLGRTKAYDLARSGRFPVPVLRLGASYRVPVAPLLAYLGISETPPLPAPRPAPDDYPARPRPGRRNRS